MEKDALYGYLYLLVIKFKTNSHVIKYNRGEEELSKAIRVGELDIRLLAKMTNQSSRKINQLLNDIQMDLERCFTSNAQKVEDTPPDESQEADQPPPSGGNDGEDTASPTLEENLD